MAPQQFTTRHAESEDDPEIATLVVEGFLDKFRPVFGRRMDQSIKIMEKWISLEHASGGVESLVVNWGDETVGSVGVRISESNEDVLARGLWRTLTRNLGSLRAIWATKLLSYPRYASRSSEAYIERLVVTPEFRGRGVARCLMKAAEQLGREAGKKTVGLHVSGNNIPAMRLYESEGYGEVSRQRSLTTGYFLGIRDWVYMRKEL